jgi:prepilin-type processing-associated H-X9-DG protein
VFVSPNLDESERLRMRKPFAHTVDVATGNPANEFATDKTIYFGGYGYNFQYLGNARKPAAPMGPYHASAAQIRNSAQTIAIADTHGSKEKYDHGEAVYVIDPQLGSVDLGSKGSRKSAAGPGSGNSYYAGGNDNQADQYRSIPAERNHGKKVGVLFCDGHAENMKLKEIDDFDKNGQVDNGYWNGKANAMLR